VVRDARAGARAGVVAPLSPVYLGSYAGRVPLFTTRDLAVYASVVGTLNGAWVLYHGVVRDRPRITVRSYRSEAIPVGGGPHQPMFSVWVSNRGRRPVNIEGVAYLGKVVRGTQMYSMDIMGQLAQPIRLDESQAHTFVHGQFGGYQPGDLPTKRWFVTDGAGRVHPLRERYRQAALAFIFWPVRRFLNWRERRERERQG
jgi:hypothetical protein